MLFSFRNNFKKIVLPLAIFALAGCSNETSFGYSFPDGIVSSEEEELTVILGASPGNQWNVEIEGEGLKLVSIEYEDEADLEISETISLEATGGMQVFEFEGTSAGDQVITFTYENDADQEDELVYIMKTSTTSRGVIRSSEMEKNGHVLGSYKG